VRLLLLVLLVIGTACMPLFVGATESVQIKHDVNQPVQITSNQLDADDKAGVFVFIGDVQAQQGDFFIYAQKMTVHYIQGEQQQLDTVIAERDVRIVQLDRVATGDKAVFYNQEGRVVLTGQPRVVQGDNAVEGERIVVYLNDNRSVVEGSTQQRVKAVFVPEGQ